MPPPQRLAAASVQGCRAAPRRVATLPRAGQVQPWPSSVWPSSPRAYLSPRTLFSRTPLTSWPGPLRWYLVWLEANWLEAIRSGSCLTLVPGLVQVELRGERWKVLNFCRWSGERESCERNVASSLCLRSSTWTSQAAFKPSRTRTPPRPTPSQSQTPPRPELSPSPRSSQQLFPSSRPCHPPCGPRSSSTPPPLPVLLASPAPSSHLTSCAPSPSSDPANSPNAVHQPHQDLGSLPHLYPRYERAWRRSGAKGDGAMGARGFREVQGCRRVGALRVCSGDGWS